MPLLRRTVRSRLAAACCGALLAMAAVAPAGAQQVERIAAVVNDDVISLFDVRQRIRMLVFSSGLDNSAEQARRLAPQALRTLIEEKLRTQEAARLNVRVTQAELDRAFRSLEQQNNVPEGRFLDYVEDAGISKRAMEDRIRADLVWDKLLRQRVIPTIEIGEEEIDAVLSRIETNQGGAQYRVAEIVLAIEGPDGEEQANALATRLLAELRSGARFEAMATQFSQSATAAVGGDLGWVQAGQLDEEIDQALAALQPGELSEPIATPDSVVIYRLLDKRQVQAPGADDLELSLRLLNLSVAADAAEAEVASQVDLAVQIGEVSETCDDFAGFATDLGSPQAPEPAQIRIGDLNDTLRNAVAGLEANQVSAPIRTPVGIQLIMVCERGDDTNQPKRDEIANQIGRERLDMLSRRYLRDLRRAAYVDVRV